MDSVSNEEQRRLRRGDVLRERVRGQPAEGALLRKERRGGPAPQNAEKKIREPIPNLNQKTVPFTQYACMLQEYVALHFLYPVL